MSADFGVTELKEILREAAGEDESVDLQGEVLDVDFAELGYDSLALLEAAAVISRKYGIKLTDQELENIATPRQLLAHIQNGLSTRVEA